MCKKRKDWQRGRQVEIIYILISNVSFSFPKRYSCTAFAYGQTGSGKTYTITGPLNQVTVQHMI